MPRPFMGGASSRPGTLSAVKSSFITKAPRDLGISAVVLSAVVVVMVVAFVPSAEASGWSPRAFVALAALPWAVLVLARQVRAGDGAARAAAALLGVAVIAALLSPAPWRSLLPVYRWHESVVFLTVAVGAWATARTLDTPGRRLVERAFLGAVAFSLAIGAIQLLANVTSGQLSMLGGRPTGLSQNPVLLGGLAVAACAWGVRSLTDAERPTRPDVVTGMTAVAAMGVWTSGSRIALAALLAVLLVALVVGVRRSLVTLALPAVSVGLLAGEVVRRLGRSAAEGSGANTADRLGGAQVSSGLGIRFDMWGFNLDAIRERPVFGHGLGNHASAVQPHLSPEFVAEVNPDLFFENWTDAHNIVIELLVTLGVVGLIAAVLFVAVQWRDLAGPSAWAVAALASTWMLQPATLVTLVPAMALLGVANRRDLPESSPIGVPVRAAAAAFSLVLATWFIGAEVTLARAESSRTVAASELAARWWWHDPTTARSAAVLGLREAVVSGEADDAEAILSLARSATDRDPRFGVWWIERGDIEQILADDDVAAESYRRAIERLPWSPAAIGSLRDLGVADQELLDRLAEIESLRAGG